VNPQNRKAHKAPAKVHSDFGSTHTGRSFCRGTADMRSGN